MNKENKTLHRLVKIEADNLKRNATSEELAIHTARGEKKPMDDKTALYIIANNSEFLKAERELKAAISKMIDVHVNTEKRCNLEAGQSNRVLDTMIQHLKEQLFTEKLLRESC